MTTPIHKTVEFKICPTQNPQPWDKIPVLLSLDLQGVTFSSLAIQAYDRAQQIANALLYFDVRWTYQGSDQEHFAQAKKE